MRRQFSPSRNGARRGFTLVEMLVVVTIIGILAALLSTAIAGAMTSAREARVLSEITGLDTALTNYASDFGVPPDFSPWDGSAVWTAAEPAYAQTVFAKHLAKRFSSSGLFDYATAQATINANYGLNIDTLDPAEALVFWLGGFYVAGKLDGFNVNKEIPLAAGGARTAPLYDFEITRLKDQDTDGWPEYYPDADVGPPFVYFASRGNGAYTSTAMYPHAPTSTVGFATPYYNNGSNAMNGKTFQIIAAGVQDNMYSLSTNPRAASPYFPGGVAFDPGDYDNLTNFHPGRLEKGLD